MDFDDTASLMSAVFISAIGTAYFMYGWKQRRPIPLVAGALLGGFPYFITVVWQMWAIAIAIIVTTYFLREK